MSSPLPPPPAQKFLVSSPKDPPANARLFLDHAFHHPDGWTLLYHRSRYWFWDGVRWSVLANDVLEQKVSWYFENAEFWGTTGRGANAQQTLQDYPVNNDSLNNLMRAIRNKVIISDKINVNTWLKPMPGDPLAHDLVPMQNGILNTGSRTLLPSTPRFFNTYALQFDYDMYAPPPSVWFSFLRSVFGIDSERINLTQEMIGYLCTPMMHLQKMFNLLGPPRCGKGTIARLVEQLVGRENYGSTSLHSLGLNFGLEGIADKPVVVLGDAAFAGGKNAGLALERLLGIIGEDSQTVDPKGQKVYSAKLPCRFLLLANNLPILPDSAQALRARWLVLRFTETFLGREDRSLGDKLSMELPGIFNWALDGLDRLRMRGDFVQPQAGKEDMDTVTKLSSPATAFIDELCITDKDDPHCRESTDLLWLAYQNWCTENGTRPKSKEWMGRDIRETTRGSHVINCKMPRDEKGRQLSGLLGIRLTEEARNKYAISEARFKMNMMDMGIGDVSTGHF